MARHESDREDLLAEATALVERVELSIAGESEPVTAGFRRDGALSVYFGSDPVYQFNAVGELRRAYRGGLLYKAERGRLVELRRERSPAEVALVRRELSDAETAALLSAARARLAKLHESLAGGTVQIVGQVPEECEVASRVRQLLADLPASLPVASTPRAKG
jgi:hypothetical protein